MFRCISALIILAICLVGKGCGDEAEAPVKEAENRKYYVSNLTDDQVTVAWRQEIDGGTEPYRIDRTLRLETGDKVHLRVASSDNELTVTYRGITRTFSRDFNVWNSEEDLVLHVSLFIGGSG